MLLVECENIKGLQGNGKDMEIYGEILAAEKMGENSQEVFKPQKKNISLLFEGFCK